jgi:hypothetical protein
MEMNSNDHGIQEQRRNIKIYEEPELREKRSANLVLARRSRGTPGEEE